MHDTTVQIKIYFGGDITISNTEENNNKLG